MEVSTYFRFILALVFVLALIALIAWAARRYGLARGTVRPLSGERRLDIVEVTPIDSKRRLILIKRDGTEHLLLLGTTQDLVIETGITAPAGSVSSRSSTKPVR